MTTTEAIQILKHYNDWRRGADIPQPEPKVIGVAIDRLISVAEKTIWIPAHASVPTNEIVQVRNDGCKPKYSHAIWNGRKWINPYLNCECKPTPTHYRPINF